MFDKEEKLKQWLECAKFIRENFTLNYPKFFDSQFENMARKHLGLQEKT